MKHVWMGVVALTALSSGLAKAQERGEAEVFVDGKYISFPTQQRPYYWSGVVMVPLKETAGKLDVEYAEVEDFVRLRFRGNEAIYRRYQDTAEVNGRTLRLQRPGEGRADILYVPSQVFESLTNRPFYAYLRAPYGLPKPTPPSVSYLGKNIRYGGGETPFSIRGTLFLPIDPTAGRTDTRVERNPSGQKGRIKIRHGAEIIWVTLGSPEAEFRDRKLRLAEPVIERDGRVFVPAEVFRRLMDREFVISGG